MADVTEVTAGILTAAEIRRTHGGAPVRDTEVYRQLNHEAGELLDCMGARWPDHRERLMRIAAWAVVALTAGEEG